MAKREPFFECIFVADHNEYRFHFRAVGPREAERHLARELESYGVAVPGELRVLDARGRVACRSEYAPRRRASA